MRYSDADGDLAVRLAREAVDAHVEGREMRPFAVPKPFEERGGAFVTLYVHPSTELRGCIGYPEPFFPLVKSIVKGAEGAAVDPRFPPLEARELDRVVVEVSLHGASAETHDRQTRVEGSFDRLLANLQEMLARGRRPYGRGGASRDGGRASPR